MTIEEVVAFGQQGLMATLSVAGPLLLVSLVVGTLVSVLQAVTQVQEVTLVFVPKIVAAFLVVAIAGGWMLQVAVGFATQMFLSIPETGG
ncbi:MAG: flagellar biosynthesis protein FliQ [Myxococcales bacterium]|nr:flagellar biosynthesis protein FliQ [Myxococcales bacterium]